MVAAGAVRERRHDPPPKPSVGKAVSARAGLALRVAGKPVKKPCILDAGELLLDREQFDDLPWKAQIQALIAETAKWFSGDAAAAALDQVLKHSILRLRQSVAEGYDLPDRLLRAVRNNPKQLFDSFDEGTRSAISKRVANDGRGGSTCVAGIAKVGSALASASRVRGLGVEFVAVRLPFELSWTPWS